MEKMQEIGYNILRKIILRPWLHLLISEVDCS